MQLNHENPEIMKFCLSLSQDYMIYRINKTVKL